jgi:hypothetical protein
MRHWTRLPLAQHLEYRVRIIDRLGHIDLIFACYGMGIPEQLFDGCCLSGWMLRCEGHNIEHGNRMWRALLSQKRKE